MASLSYKKELLVELLPTIIIFRMETQPSATCVEPMPMDPQSPYFMIATGFVIPIRGWNENVPFQQMYEERPQPKPNQPHLPEICNCLKFSNLVEKYEGQTYAWPLDGFFLLSLTFIDFLLIFLRLLSAQKGWRKTSRETQRSQGLMISPLPRSAS